jgi:hypothetical protein
VNAGDVELELYSREDGDTGWRLRHANARIIAISGEGYRDRADAAKIGRRVEAGYRLAVLDEDGRIRDALAMAIADLEEDDEVRLDVVDHVARELHRLMHPEEVSDARPSA